MVIIERVTTEIEAYQPMLLEKYNINYLGILELVDNYNCDPKLKILIDYIEAPSLLDVIDLENWLSEKLEVDVNVLTKKGLDKNKEESVFSEVILGFRSRGLTEYLDDILKRITLIKSLTDEEDFESFKENERNFLAIIQSLVVIGEAIKNVPPDVREKYPHVPWKKVAGMRDKLVHEYWAIDEQVIWETIRKYIPQLKIEISQVREDFSRK